MVHIYLRQRCSDSSVNRTILKSWLAVAARQDFPNVKFRIAAHIRYRRKQSGSGIRTMMRIRLKKLISSSMSWHLSTRSILSKSMHVFLSNLANKQTDRQTWAKTHTSCFVGRNNCQLSRYWILVLNIWAYYSSQLYSSTLCLWNANTLHDVLVR